MISGQHHDMRIGTPCSETVPNLRFSRTYIDLVFVDVSYADSCACLFAGSYMRNTTAFAVLDIFVYCSPLFHARGVCCTSDEKATGTIGVGER